MILYRPYSPIEFRMNRSPHNAYYSDFQMSQQISFNDDFFPFDQQPLQKMFDYQASNQQSPSMKQVVIRQSLNKQQGFQIVHINTLPITPQKPHSNVMKRVSIQHSEKKDRRSIYPPKEQIVFSTQKERIRFQKNYRSLRNLSIRIRDIVLEQKSASYKDVADRLILDLGEDDLIVESDTSKDESNIKRRVYDALNVMIASKILRKEGKKVLSDIYNGHKGRTKKNETEINREKLQNLKKMLFIKRKRLQELYTKIMALKNLIQRNEHNPTESKFMFPILSFKADQKQIQLRKDQSTLKIKSHNQLEVLADLDILVEMKMYKLYPNLINIMPNELQNLVRIVDAQQQ